MPPHHSYFAWCWFLLRLITGAVQGLLFRREPREFDLAEAPIHAFKLLDMLVQVLENESTAPQLHNQEVPSFGSA